MAGCWKYDVFPSFSGEDVRKSFLSHFLEKLQSKSIITFIDNGIERSRPIAPELLLAIRVSKISIVVFSKKYASSTWCLNELAEIHKCYKELNQMVIPIFYDVDPSDVRKQTGEFGKAFDETCKGKSEDLYRSWVRALVAVANMAGEDLQNWRDEADMIEKISKDVLNKLITPSDDFRDYVGIQEHIEAIMDSKLCLESGGVRMVGIVGPSGIGKTTIARALFQRLSNQFDHRAFVFYKRTNLDDYDMKLCWAKQFVSDILCQNDIEIDSLGVVEQRLKHNKVLIVLDDVDEIELLETLVGQSGWFGFGSRIIVVTRDRALLNAHEIDLIYEVQYPSEELALKMFCRSAFRRNSPPDDFEWYADLVVRLCGNLPLGLNVLGSSLRGKDKEYWEEMMPRLRDSLDGKIEKTLRISYDELDGKDQELFLYIACLFNGEKAKYIKDLLKGSVSIGLRILADKSLIRLTSPHKTVQMHTLLEKLGREIVRAESIYNPGKRRFLVDANDISDVLQDDTGIEKNVLGIRLNVSEIKEPLYIDENSFKGMHSLQIIKLYSWSGNGTGEVKFDLPQGQVIYLPRKLRLLHWVEYPANYIPSSFSAQYLVELRMVDSKLEKLWQGTQSLRNLKTMELSGSRYLKEIPNLSKATNLEEMFLGVCTGLAMLPSSIQHLDKLETLEMRECTSLEVLPNNINLLSLSWLNLSGCSRLTSFPQLSTSIGYLFLDRTAIEEVPSWIEKIAGLKQLSMTGCKKLRKISATICNLKHLVRSFDYHTVFSDSSLVQTVAELHPESIKYYTKVLSGSRSTCGYLLARGAQEFILQRDFKYAVLPGKEVPMYFTHRTHGRSLTVPLPRSSLSLNNLEFAGCIILDLDLDYVTDFQDFYYGIFHKMIVHWRFTGVTGICSIKPATDPRKMDNLVVFHFGFDNGEEADDSSSQSDYNNVEFEFESHYGNGDYCDCYSLLSVGDYGLETWPVCPQRIKGCGVRVLGVSPSLHANATISETAYYQQDGGRDAESERSSESEDNHQSSESDAESKRSKKRMRMTAITSQEPCNLQGSQAVADTGIPDLNLELSLGLTV